MGERSVQRHSANRADSVGSPSVDSPQDARKRLETALLLISRNRVQLIFLLLVIAIGAGFFALNSQPAVIRMTVLDRLGAHPMTNRYADFRFVLAGIGTSRNGVDVWTTCKPCGTAVGIEGDLPFNYPAAMIWLGHIAPARITPNDANWMGPLIDFAFLVCAALLLLSPHRPQAIFSLALLVSPPVLLGLERANCDLIIFCLVLINLLLIDRWSNGCAYASAFCLGLLKIYPVVTIIGLLRRTKESLLGFAAVIAAELIFIASSLKNIYALARNTPRTFRLSYGYPVDFLAVSARFRGVPEHIAPSLALPFLFMFCTITVLIVWRSRKFLLSFLFKSGRDERSAFLAGAATFSVSFALGSNYNYRLIFLLFIVPHLFATLRNSEGKAKRLARYLLGVVLAVFWAEWRVNPLTFMLESALTWLLFAFLSATSMVALYWAFLLPTGQPFQSEIP